MCVRPSIGRHPVGFQLSKNRNIDVWNKWYLEFGSNLVWGVLFMNPGVIIKFILRKVGINLPTRSVSENVWTPVIGLA